MKKFLILITFTLSGCASEVDKCVESAIKSLNVNYPAATAGDKAEAEKISELFA
jgi:hypothetical protein